MNWSVDLEANRNTLPPRSLPEVDIAPFVFAVSLSDKPASPPLRRLIIFVPVLVSEGGVFAEQRSGVIVVANPDKARKPHEV